MQANPFETLVWFKKNYQELIIKMKECSQDISVDEQSLYHAEGDVYTHSLMVYAFLHKYRDIEVSLAGLLHDISKPFTRIKKPEKASISFTFHDNLSAFKSLDILRHYEKDFNITLNKELIIKAIYFHQILHKIGSFNENVFTIDNEEEIFLNKVFGNDLELYSFLLKLGRADLEGRVSFDYEASVARYDFLDDFIPYSYYKENKVSMPKAYMLSGLPASGKSEFVKSLKDDFIYLSSDEIMREFYKDKELPYNMYYSSENVEKAEAILYERLKEAVQSRKNIVIDQTNLTEKIRNRKATIIPDKYYEKISICFLVSEKDLIKRNELRKKEGKFIPLDTLMYKAKEFELPTCEVFDRVEIVIS